ncbi:MAG: cell division protein SepF [Acidimicrobiales bacterium]
MLKKAMIYLGLGPDEEYAAYDEYEAGTVGDVTAPGPRSAPPRPEVSNDRPLVHPVSTERATVHPQAGPAMVRPIAGGSDPPAAGPAVRPIEPRPSDRRAPDPSPPPVARPDSSGTPAVRTIGPAVPKPHAVTPTSFNDAQEIGDRLKNGQPVIVNLQAVDRDLRRRLVDFASGLCYALGAKMDRVADQVYMLTPPDVAAGSRGGID